MDIPAVHLIQKYINNGGILICLLTGHEYVDSILTAKGFKGQLMINIASANSHNHIDGIISDDSSSAFYDCFDLCGIDTDNGIIKVLRIGWTIDSAMKIREVFSYDYLNNEIIAH